ncbi:MAG: hypothetical protein IPL52_08010 [Flavobacteriales bacterium]|nr:hypothetical protein [Flavobacteriales bacterium]
MPAQLRSVLFFLVVLALCSWHLDAGRNDNTISRAAMVAALVEHGSLCIDPYHELTKDKALVDGHYYSEKAPLPALLVAPFWFAAHRIGWVQPGEHGLLTDGLLRLGGFLCGSLPLSLIILLTWRRLRTLASPIPSTWLAALPFIGSFLFVYSGSFHGHLLAALLLLLAWRLRALGSFLPSGFLAGAAVLCEYSLFVFPLVWLVQDALRMRWRAVGAQVFGGLPAFLLVGFMNLMVTGHPLELPYADVAEHVDRSGGAFGLGAPSIAGLYGLLFGGFRGLFTHAPVAILCAFVAIAWMRRCGWRSTLLHPLVIPSLLLVLMIAGHSMWWGGWAFGPRHLTSVAVLLLAATLPRLPDRPWVDGALVWMGAWGLVVAIAAKCTTWYSLPTEIEHPFRDMILPRILHGLFTNSQWPVDAGFSPIMGSMLFLLAFGLSMRFLRTLETKI